MSGLWVMERTEGALELYLADEEVTAQSAFDGINPVTARRALLAGSKGQAVVFQSIDEKGEISEDPMSVKLTDFMFWSWIPIFSEKARRLVIEMGVSQDDLVHCRLDSRSDELFLHLPARSYDVIDLEASQFTTTVPLHPPIPFNLRKLGLRGVHKDLPHCFRMAVPGHNQVFPELIVSEAMRTAWSDAQLTGAAFRRVA